MKKTLYLLLFVLFCLVGCVPTPEEEPVINQFSDTTQVKKMESVEEIPSKWQETIEQNNVTLKFDAKVTGPDTLQIQERYFEPRIFSQEEVDAIVSYFAQDKKLYVFPADLTKSDYEQMYLDALKGTEVDGEYVITEDSEKLIEELQEKLLSASEDGGKQYTDSTLTFDIDLNRRRDVTLGGKNFLSVAIDSGKHEDATLSIRNYVPGYNNASMIVFDTGTGIIEESLLSKTERTGTWIDLPNEKRQEYQFMLDGVSISLETVDANAQQIMRDLNFPSMKRVSAEKAILISYGGDFGVDSMRPPIAGWWVTFMRDYGECPCLSNMEIYISQRNEEIADYSAPTNVEVIRAFFSDNGLERFYYDGALNEDTTRTKKVSIISFSRIQDIAKKQLYYQQAFLDDNPDLKKEVVIDSVTLKLVYVREQNSESRLRLIPAWVFSGQCRYLLNGEEIIDERVSLIISAENGGVIRFGEIQNY